MNGMRKVFYLLSALLLVAFAVPAFAATKSISLSVTPSALTTSTIQVFATITNTGNSNANSFEVDWSTSPNFVVASGQVGTDPLVYPTPPGLKGPGYSRLVFLKQVPNKSSVTVTLNVTVTGVNQCASSSIDWWAYAWTGAPGPASQSFTLPPGPYTTGLPSSATCTIAFDTQPTDAFIGSTITGAPFDSTGGSVGKVGVKLLQNGAAPPATNVSVSATTACAIAAANATTDGTGIAKFTSLSSAASATTSGCVLTASADGYGSVGSNAFKVVKPDGVLNCGDFIHGGGSTVYDPAGDGPFFGDAGWGLRRGQNTDNTCTHVIPFTFTFDPGTPKAGFVADKLGQSIIVEYVLVTNAILTAPNGWLPTRQPKFAWGTLPHNPPIDAEFIAGLACNNDDITGALGSPLPTIPNVSPYSDPGQFTQYQPNQPALMCAAQQGWTSIPGGKVQFWLKVIDTDGWTEP